MKLVGLFLSLFYLTACAHEQLKPLIIEDQFKNPESIYLNPEDKHIYVSNVNGAGTGKDGKGYISKLDDQGKVIKLKWLTGLNAPKGSRAFKGALWVADIDQIVKIDIAKAAIVERIKIKGAKFLNDIAISQSGAVFVSDTLASRIYKFEDNRLSVFAQGSELESPNGLLFVGEKLFVASWGLTTDWSTKIAGRVFEIDLDTKKRKYITKLPLGNLDGLELDENGDFIVSDYVGGKVFRVSRASGKTKLIYSGQKSLADIGYNTKTKQLLIPYLELNKVVITPHN